MTGTTNWHVLTGEYPPGAGGVADYTRLVAGGLAAAGDRVAVSAPPHPATGQPTAGVSVRRLPDHFGPRGLITLEQDLVRTRPHRILIQYVPQAFGWHGMNVPFAVWVATRAHRIAPVWVMFHEVMCSDRPGQSLQHAVLGRVTRQMARWVAGAAERVFVSIPAWGWLLRRICRTAPPAEWLPIPSNVPAAVRAADRAAARAAIAHASVVVVGHFGTFGAMNGRLVGPPVAELLRRSADRVGVFVGRGSDTYLKRFTAEHPDLVGRVSGTGELPAAVAAAYLAACDLLVQPYPDGVSSRRGSAMAGIALGVPTVTNTGFLSEPIWDTPSSGIAVARSPAPADLVPAAETVLALPPSERAARGLAAAVWYRSQFALEHTVARLRSTRTTA